MTTIHEALAAFEDAFHTLRKQLQEKGAAKGTLYVTFSISGRSDGDKDENFKPPKISLSQGNYQSYTTTDNVEGLEWDEVVGEFVHRLARDAALVRLTDQRKKATTP